MSQAHAQETKEIVRLFGANPERGFTEQEAQQRLREYGKNTLVQPREIRFLSIFREEVTEPMILLLIAIGVIYSVLGVLTHTGLTDAVTIIVIIILLVLAEVWNEYRAKRSIASLKKLAPPTSLVLREGVLKDLQTDLIVPGDVLLLGTGQRVPADARLLESFGVEADESSLTGESFPVTKDASVVLPQETKISDQTNMLFAGTTITKGRAKALVTGTGLNTELGKVVGITRAAKEPKTTLQLAMKQLSKTLVWIAVFFSILIPILSYVRGVQTNPGLAILYGLSLAFVVIPEELPIIITMVLGVGSNALSRKGAIVKRLRASETLGNVTVIATDKTGTLTENKMRVEHLYLDGLVQKRQDFDKDDEPILKMAFLASDGISSTAGSPSISNPMARAIRECLKEDGVDIPSITSEWVLKNELSFDVKRKLASYIYHNNNFTIVFSSGAPEKLLESSTKILIRGKEQTLTQDKKAEVNRVLVDMASSGDRLLGFGYTTLKNGLGLEKKDLETKIVFIGIIGFIDPPRKEVKGAINACHEAGIKVIMITGDHPETAKAVASQVGIDSSKVLSGNEIAKMADNDLKKALRGTYVFARATPEDKLRLVRLLKENGEIVAVTGDGINDAPALKEAHIGISMGIRGTDIAKETADVILTDDNFATIETAVKEGRKLYSNLRKGVRYYLACKVALVSIFLVPIILGIPLPFAPIQIIVLELFMDLAASATFVAEPAEAGIMQRPPKSPNERFLKKSLLTSLVFGALSLFSAVTIAYLFTWFRSPVLTASMVQHAQTVAFATWMLGHILLALNFRSEKEPLWKLGILSNKVMITWALMAVGTLLVATTIPVFATALKITSLTLTDWAVALLASFVATFWMELKKTLKPNT